MVVSLTPEQEKLIAKAIGTGHYRDATEVLDDALHALEEKQRATSLPATDRDQAIQRLTGFGKRHGLSLGDDLTITDLIDAGRR
jgi:Arc/MetJ-type ribon-helix-helix transcriptional regulator